MDEGVGYIVVRVVSREFQMNPQYVASMTLPNHVLSPSKIGRCPYVSQSSLIKGILRSSRVSALATKKLTLAADKSNCHDKRGNKQHGERWS